MLKDDGTWDLEDYETTVTLFDEESSERGYLESIGITGIVPTTLIFTIKKGEIILPEKYESLLNGHDGLLRTISINGGGFIEKDGVRQQVIFSNGNGQHTIEDYFYMLDKLIEHLGLDQVSIGLTEMNSGHLLLPDDYNYDKRTQYLVDRFNPVFTFSNR